MRITFQLTADDYQQGLLAWRNLKAWRRWLLRCSYLSMSLTIAAAVLLSVFAGLGRQNLKISEAIFAFAALWFVYMWAAPRFSSRRQYRNTPSAHSPITLDVSDTGIHIQSAYADSKVEWPTYVAWGEYKSVFVILPQPRIYVPIPKRAFTEEQQSEFREILRRNVLTQKQRQS